MNYSFILCEPWHLLHIRQILQREQQMQLLASTDFLSDTPCRWSVIKAALHCNKCASASNILHAVVFDVKCFKKSKQKSKVGAKLMH